MPILMMTSVDTIYSLQVNDTVPGKGIAVPRVEAKFVGRTDYLLKKPTGQISQEEAEHTCQQQGKYLDDAAHVAISVFNPNLLGDQRFRASVELAAVTGCLQPFGDQSESSGLAYTLALALNWGQEKGFFGDRCLPSQPIFATGSIPSDGYLKPIASLLEKIRYACDYIEQQEEPLAKSNYSERLDKPSFYILIPKANYDAYNEAHSDYQHWRSLVDRVDQLGGKIVALTHASDALALLMGDGFDGGIYTHGNQGFPGLSSISYERRHLFMGREALINELVAKSHTALEQGYVLNVQGVSGSGKSSAVLAGLIPTLLMPESPEHAPTFDPNWLSLRPNEFNCFETLLTQLFESLTQDDHILHKWLDLKSDPVALASAIAEHQGEATHLPLWVIDQYEELFNHAQIESCDASKLFELLAAIAEQTDILIITVLRTEYLGELGGHASTDVQLPRRIQPQEIGRIIELQLQYHRLNAQSAQESDDNLKRQQHLETRIKDAAAGKPLTSVSYLLQQMHQKMLEQDPSSRELTHAYYEAVGGINGVMAHQAELALEEGLKGISPEEQEGLINAFFEAFIGIDEDQQPVARALPNNHIDHYVDGLDVIIQSFMAKGLIIDCGRGNTPKIKLAHDTLLSTKTDQPHWQRLLGWFERKRGYLNWRKKIEPDYLSWLQASVPGDENQGKARSFLIRDSKLFNQLYVKRPKVSIEDQQLQIYIQLSKASRIRRAFLPSALLLLLMVVSGFYYWDQNYRIKSEYAAYLGEKYGVPFGVTFLTEEQRSKKVYHYRLDYQGGKLVELSHRNSYGYLKNDDKRGSARWVYEYKSNGHLLSVKSYTSLENPAETKTYQFTSTKSEALVSYRYQGKDTEIGSHVYQGGFSEEFEAKSSITQHRLTFNKQGWLEKEVYLDSSDFPTSTSEGVYGLIHSYNKQGLELSEIYLGIKGEPFPFKGVVETANILDGMGNIIEQIYLNEDRSLVINENGFSQLKVKYDSQGNLVEGFFYGVDGNPTLHNKGYHSIKREYDFRGNIIGELYYGIEGEPVNNVEGYFSKKYKYDDLGNIIYSSVYGVDSKSIINGDGFFAQKNDYDNRGNAIRSSFYGLDSKPVVIKSGISVVERTFDERGNIKVWSYYGLDNKPIIRDGGYSSVEYVFDKQGNEVSRSYYGVDNNPVIRDGNYSSVEYIYDKRGNEITRSYYGVGGKPTLFKDGYSSVKRIFDAKGNQVARSYYGIDGEATFHKDGISSLKRTFDERGNEIGRFYFGVDGKPIHHKNGESSVKRSFDDRGNEVTTAYFGIDGKPTLLSDGYSSVKRIFDAKGNQVARSYYGVDGKPTFHKDGESSIKKTFDSRGNEVATAYFGIDGTPTLRSNGYSSVKRIFDAKGNEVATAYFGIDGTPTLRSNGYSSVKRIFDVKGNEVATAYFGIDGKPTLLSNGYSSVKRKFDVKGDQVEESYYGVDGKSILHKDGYSIVKLTFDGRGNRVEESYYGVDGKSILHKGGYSIGKLTFDGRGNQVAASYYGVDRKAALNVYGYSTAKMAYDTQGNRASWFFYGVDGEPVRHTDGMSVVKKVFDERGNNTITSHYDADGEPTLIKGGFSTIKRVYDVKGNEISWSYYGIDDKPVGYDGREFLVKAVFDGVGNRITTSYFGVDGKQIFVKQGYSSVKRTYDIKGNNTSISFYGVSDSPVLVGKGFSKVLKKYDVYGNEIGKEYFDEENNSVSFDKYNKSVVGYNEIESGGSRSFINISLYDERNGHYIKTINTIASVERLEENLYINRYGDLIDNKYGYSRRIERFNSSGERVELSYFNGNGLVAIGQNKYAKKKWLFDENNNLIELGYYDADGVLVYEPSSGYAKKKYKFDSDGRLVEEVYLGSDGDYLLNSDSYSKLKIEYDSYGNVIRKSYYDHEGSPVMAFSNSSGKKGFFRQVFEYDGGEDGAKGKWRKEDVHGNYIKGGTTYVGEPEIPDWLKGSFETD